MSAAASLLAAISPRRCRWARGRPQWRGRPETRLLGGPALLYFVRDGRVRGSPSGC